MKRRFNIFNAIHKALRGMLYDTALCLQIADFSIEEEGLGSMEKVELLLSILQIHAIDEARFIFPPVKQYDTLLAAAFETEQVKNEIAYQGLRNLVRSFYEAENQRGREEAGEQMFQTFNEFLALQLMHMNRQEIQLNEILWKHFSDNDLIKISKEIQANIPPEINYIECNWMLKCNSNREVIAWMGKIKDHAPHFVFESILELAERVLCEKRWQKIRESLSEGELALER